VDLVDAGRLAAGVALLSAASVQDWRTRLVSDRIWVALGSVGLALIAAEAFLTGLPPEHLLILVPAAVLFYTTFYGEELLTEEGWHFRPVRIGLFAAAAGALVLEGYLLVPRSGANALLFFRDLTIPAMILLGLGFYMTGLLHGGADLKALMAITLITPLYPALAGLPLTPMDPRLAPALETLFPFSLAVLTNAALLFVVSPIAMVAVNVRRGTVRFPHALFGYLVPIDRVPRFAWLMERMEGGRRRHQLLPRRTDDRRETLDGLLAAGAKDVWVIPQIPFIIPMTIGFVVGFVFGNVLLSLMSLGLSR